MVKNILQKIIEALVQIFLVATIIFIILHIMPGDPVEIMLEANGTTVTEETIQAVRDSMGLNDPVMEQYGHWIKGLFTFQFGDSYYYKKPVATFVAERLPRTIELALVSILLAIIFGIVMGVASARGRGSVKDTILSIIAVLGISIPMFVTGTLLIYLFAIKLQWLPSGGYAKLAMGYWQHLRTIILPAVTVGFYLTGSIARITRSSMLEELDKEYIQTLNANGLKRQSIIYKHALKNAVIPIITVIGLQLGSLIGGIVVIENIYNYAGISSLVVEAVNRRDYPMIQTCVVMIAAVYILINMAVDIAYGIADPKIRAKGRT